MGSILNATLVCCLPLALAGPAQPADADARAIIEKAVKAVGGEDRLGKFPASTWKGKGKHFGMGEGIEFITESAMALPERLRSATDFEVQGMKIQFVMVINGDKGWTKANDVVEEMAADMLAEEKAGMYASWVATLAPLLKDKAFELAPLGEGKVGDKPVLGVKVSRKDRRDVSLFFDKESGLLLRTEFRAKDVMGGNEYTQETLFSDYQETDGIKRPRKVLINRDGKRFVEFEVQQRKFLEKVDENLFAKP
jgi:hypothetical protein